MHNNYTTKRATVPAIEDLLFEPLKVLDHGFIRVIDYMGDDSSIVQAARVSYGKGTKQLNQDKGLINYLMRHKHTTPFEMCDIKFHIKLPIFVARQWIRHRTASVNEYSARYSILGNEFYLPDRQNLASQSLTNKQGRSDEEIPKEIADKVLALLEEDAKTCYQHYTAMMNQDEQGNIIDPNTIGITRELARMNLTLNYYTEWYWKVNLHNLLNFLLLRADPHAQYEIRVYADKMLDIVKNWLPLTYEAFNEYRVEGSTISKKGLAVIKKLINHENITQETSGMTRREWDELMQVIK
ncbi:FAD-dependent thymidylate synthase [Candidatus Tisiphia endosymbiont of Nemotelus uliginosus]|uniref:FAD-dependent thymidylate synthase n=1 Tax=Candidatus Tisiphia endosymbiont of Nemotelus uliginosus TaxID=3077926 RepID=UPI0035C8B3E1